MCVTIHQQHRIQCGREWLRRLPGRSFVPAAAGQRDPLAVRLSGHTSGEQSCRECGYRWRHECFLVLCEESLGAAAVTFGWQISVPQGVTARSWLSRREMRPCRMPRAGQRVTHVRSRATCRCARGACSRAGAVLLRAPLGSGGCGGPGRALFGVEDPADELVAGQWREGFPRCERSGVGDQRRAQVGWHLVRDPARHALADSRASALDGVLALSARPSTAAMSMTWPSSPCPERREQGQGSPPRPGSRPHPPQRNTGKSQTRSQRSQTPGRTYRIRVSMMISDSRLVHSARPDCLRARLSEGHVGPERQQAVLTAGSLAAQDSGRLWRY
jgi:hypothetical protein